MSNAEGVGTGGDLGYLTETPDSSVWNQEDRFSCVAACVRTLLLRVGVDRPEQELRDEIGYHELVGATSESVHPVLNRWHPHLEFEGGHIDGEAIHVVLRRDPWIAFLQTDRGSIHAVVVLGETRGVVSVLDPWGIEGPGSGSGTAATLSFDEFFRRWDAASCAAIIPQRLKRPKP